MSLHQKEAIHKIAQLIAEAQKKISEAEFIANEAGVGFHMDIGGYGMGGYYDPHDQEWQASSHSC